eukprot:1143524-Pelagomonas_calceolata.AAC.6
MQVLFSRFHQPIFFAAKAGNDGGCEQAAQFASRQHAAAQLHCGQQPGLAQGPAPVQRVCKVLEWQPATPHARPRWCTAAHPQHAAAAAAAAGAVAAAAAAEESKGPA